MQTTGWWTPAIPTAGSNYPGLASSDEAGRTAPNIQRIYDSWFNVFDQRARPVHGRLATDRPHQVEIRAAYTAPRGWSVGFHQYFGSGTPRTTEALRQGVFFFPYGRGDLGRNPTLTQTDLRLGFGRRVAKVRLDAALVVANLFDEDAVTAVAEHPYRDQVQLTDEEFRRGFDIHEVAARQGMRANPDYGMPVRFQAPRSVRVGIGLRW
jgi:hypothetical protein